MRSIHLVLPHNRSKWTALSVLMIWLVLHLMEELPYQKKLHSLVFDTYQTLAPRPRVSAPVVIIDIDEASLQRFGQWPWPRNLLAMLLVRIEAMNPVAVGLDVIMPEPDRSSPCTVARYIPKVAPKLVKQVCSLPSNDALLADALRKGPTVLGIAGLDDLSAVSVQAPPLRAIGGDPGLYLRNFAGSLNNLEELNNAAKGHAILSVDLEDGVVQRIPLALKVGQTIVPALSVEMLRLAVGSSSFTIKSNEKGIEGVSVGDLFVPTQQDGSIWVHYSHHDASRFISAVQVLDGTIKAEVLADKLVIIGMSGLGLVDFPTTALGERVPGAEIHAQLLESIFDHSVLLRPYWAKWVEVFFTAVFGLLIIACVSRVNPLFSVSLALLVESTILLTCFIIYLKKNWLLDGATPVLTWTLLLGAMLIEALMSASAQKKVLEEAIQVQRLDFAKQAGEMEAAKRIQMGILPNSKQVNAKEARLDIAARMEPAKAVGGDLYDFFKLDDDRLFFIIGDVCGKGVPASLFMAISKTLIKSLALKGDLQLSELVSQANLEISRENSEMLFVTAFLGILDLQTGELVYCNAGHEKPMLLSANHTPITLNAMGGPAICIIEDYRYAVAYCQLRVGEFICLISDGITEAYNPDKDLFGNKRLTEALFVASTSVSAEAFVDSVCQSVHQFAAGAEPSDDLTILTIRWLGG